MRAYKKSETKYFKTIYEKSIAGTYEIDLEAGEYLVELYGAGGGWANSSWTTDTHYCRTSGGGSGAYFKGIIRISGTTSITIGAGGKGVNYGRASGSGGAGGNTTIGNIVSAGGGGGAYTVYMNGADNHVGYGGTVSILDNSAILLSIQNSSGNNGSTITKTYSTGPADVAGGASLYDGSSTGFGAGGGYPNEAKDGYIKIEAKSTPSDYTTVIETVDYKLPKINEKYYIVGDLK